MITRSSHSELKELLDIFPVVGILGPRQVGKTTLAKKVSEAQESIYIDLELPEDLAKLADPPLFFSAYKEHLIILDEIQIRQDLFPILRALIDQDRRSGRFLILGSTSPGMMRQSAESLAGRIAYLDMHPLSLPEVGVDHLNKHWLRGGFPLSFLAKSDRSSQLWRTNFTRTYIERDLVMLGLPNNPVFLRKFWTMAAHMNGKLSNYNQIGRSLQVTNPTVRDYYDMFVNTFLLYELSPFYKNLKKRLVKSPKYYINDTGLLHSFLNIKSLEELYGHPDVGLSWESYVINQVRNVIRAPYALQFYRTHQGAEVDLLITLSDEPFVSCEIKLTNAPKVSKGMNIAIQDVGTEYNFIITPSSDRYPLSESIESIGLFQFLEWMKELQEK